MVLNIVDGTAQHTLDIIFDEVYTKINEHYLDIFLCGGASTPSEISTRDKLREYLSSLKGIRVLYPEDLFIEMMQKDKKYNLLTLEKFLADNSDFICIVCESAGSLVELGAFTNNIDTVEKVIAVVKEKHKKKKSFVMLGPVKVLNEINKNRVVYYKKEDINGLNQKLKLLFESKGFSGFRRTKVRNSKPLDTIIGLYYFIPLMLFFYKSIEYGKITDYLKYLFEKKNFNLQEFKTLFNSSLKLLYKDKYINKTIHSNKSFYSLSNRGYEYINNVLYNINIENRNVLYDKIRFGIIRDVYY